MTLLTYAGGCHCGAVRFEVDLDEHRAVDCNCSICTKKGFLHLLVGPERFRLVSGAEHLETYTFNTGVAKHLFCRRCGIHPFYRPRSNPDGYSVNLRCLDDAPLERFTLEPFDGANWEDAVSRLDGRVPTGGS
jgi:hypothetical protein